MSYKSGLHCIIIEIILNYWTILVLIRWGFEYKGGIKELVGFMACQPLSGYLMLKSFGCSYMVLSNWWWWWWL